MVLSAIAQIEAMYEQGDMEGMKEPKALAGEYKALQNARSAIYQSGFRWSA